MTKIVLKMKLFFTLCVCITVASCSSSKSKLEKTYFLIGSRAYSNYMLLSYSTKDDTLMCIIDREIYNRCISIKKIAIPKKGQVETLETNLKTLAFVIDTKSTNGIKMLSGSIEPGNEKYEYIKTYSDYPFLLTDCSAFKN